MMLSTSTKHGTSVARLLLALALATTVSWGSFLSAPAACPCAASASDVILAMQEQLNALPVVGPWIQRTDTPPAANATVHTNRTDGGPGLELITRGRFTDVGVHFGQAIPLAGQHWTCTEGARVIAETGRLHASSWGYFGPGVYHAWGTDKWANAKDVQFEVCQRVRNVLFVDYGEWRRSFASMMLLSPWKDYDMLVMVELDW